MRWVLVFLVVLNIAYWVWQRSQTNPADGAQSNIDEVVDSGADKLELLSEMPPELIAQKTIKVTAKAGPYEEQALCWILGPFTEIVTAKQVLLRFQALDIPVTLRNIEGITGRDYLVYLGPYPSRADALGKLRMLQELQIDSFLITRGTLNDGISLGLFPKRSQAEILAEELVEMGYEVKIREEKRSQLKQWLVIPVAAADKLARTFWQELELDFAGLDRQQKWCDAIASAGSID
jgi:hypothetical protein